MAPETGGSPVLSRWAEGGDEPAPQRLPAAEPAEGPGMRGLPSLSKDRLFNPEVLG